MVDFALALGGARCGFMIFYSCLLKFMVIWGQGCKFIRIGIWVQGGEAGVSGFEGYVGLTDTYHLGFRNFIG